MDTLDHLKKLCRIDCDPDEEQDILNSLNQVLDYIHQLNEVPTEEISREGLKNRQLDDSLQAGSPHGGVTGPSRGSPASDVLTEGQGAHEHDPSGGEKYESEASPLRSDSSSTSGIKPCNSVLGKMAKQKLREDEITEPLLSKEKFLSNAPDQIAGMIRIPPVLKAP